MIRCPDSYLDLQTLSNQVLPSPGDFTHSAAKVCLKDCLLRVEIVHPDSINDMHNEKFSGPAFKVG
jgi:hypothetical protein